MFPKAVFWDHWKPFNEILVSRIYKDTEVPFLWGMNWQIGVLPNGEPVCCAVGQSLN